MILIVDDSLMDFASMKTFPRKMSSDPRSNDITLLFYISVVIITKFNIIFFITQTLRSTFLGITSSQILFNIIKVTFVESYFIYKTTLKIIF